jgi:predicted ATP-grasp superfamily ATP-dependent carboligase
VELKFACWLVLIYFDFIECIGKKPINIVPAHAFSLTLFAGLRSALKVFIYEFVTGGGLLIDPALGQHAQSLEMEGRAMRDALIEDFLLIEDLQVITLQDNQLAASVQPKLPARVHSRLQIRSVNQRAQAESEFMSIASAADFTIVIAPEINGHLLRTAKKLDAFPTRLLGPSTEFISIAADKLLTSKVLQRADCPTIATFPFDVELAHAWLQSGSPVVVKPRDGAGSADIRICWECSALPTDGERLVIQPLYSGSAVSIAGISGRNSLQLLPVCTQELAPYTANEPFVYRGGRLLADQELQQRAENLARRVFAAMPPAIGYVGIDLLLDERGKCEHDCVVEINPRLTTSYLGLRKACYENLAQAMIAAACGKAQQLSFREEPIHFNCERVLCPG